MNRMNNVSRMSNSPNWPSKQPGRDSGGGRDSAPPKK